MGTPDLAAAVLRRLVRWPGGDVVAVYRSWACPCTSP